MFRRSRKILGQKPHTDPNGKPFSAAPVQVTIDYHDRTRHYPGRSEQPSASWTGTPSPTPFAPSRVPRASS